MLPVHHARHLCIVSILYVYSKYCVSFLEYGDFKYRKWKEKLKVGLLPEVEQALCLVQSHNFFQLTFA